MANITRTKINTLIFASVLTANIASAVGIVKIPTDATTTENAKILLSTPTLENSAYKLTETQSEGDFTITKYINNEGILSAVDYNVLFNNPLGDTSGTATSFWWTTDTADNRILTTDGTDLGDADIIVNVDSQKNVRVDTTDNAESISITNSFAGVTTDVNTDGEQYGSAIYNAAEKTITKISGDFVGNSLTLTTALESDNFLKGGVIANYGTIGDITGSFVGNSAISSNSCIQGGAIYNVGSLDSIKGDFIGNYAKIETTESIPSVYTYGGAIYNTESIKSIEGDFINNYTISLSTSGSGSNAAGGAIYNTGSIESIEGDFIANYSESSGSSDSGGAIYNEGVIGTISGDFINNYAKTITNNTWASSYGGAISNKNKINYIYGDFISNNVISMYKNAYGGAIYNQGNIGLIKGDFISNTVTTYDNSGYGGAIYNSATMDSIIGNFINNNVISYGSGWAVGGAISSVSGTVSAKGSFIGNYVSSLSASSLGGAIYITSGTINLSADSGDVYSYGNWAASGVEWNDDGSLGTVLTSSDDANGGFLYMNGAGTVYFEVGADSNGNAYTMTIGEENGKAGYDSIASSSTSSIINKTGDGTLTVNSSMQYYTGALNVTEGTMEVNNKLGASSITIGTADNTSATLALTVSQDNVLSYTGSLSFKNYGTLSLSASASDLLSLSTETKSISYTLSAASNATSIDYGNLVLYGGILDNNIFTISLASTVSSDDFKTESVVLTGSSNILITDSNTKSNVTISTSSSTSATTEAITISEVSENTSSIVAGNSIYTAISEDVSSDFTVLSSWDFDIEFADDTDSVVVSFLVGEGYDLSSISLYHTDDNDNTTDVTESIISYDDEGYLSFQANSFCSYTAIAVPEPSTYAMIFGALALGLAMYRRRK